DGIRDRTVTGVQTCALPILLIARGLDDRRLSLITANRLPRHFDSDLVRHLNLHALLAETRNLPVYSPRRDDLVVHLQMIEELLHLLLLPLGRQQNDEIENPKNQNERYDL